MVTGDDDARRNRQSEALDYRAERIAERAAEKVLRANWRLLGIDPDDQESINNMREDFSFLRRQRQTHEQRRSDILKQFWSGAVALLLGAVSTIAAFLWHTSGVPR